MRTLRFAADAVAVGSERVRGPTVDKTGLASVA